MDWNAIRIKADAILLYVIAAGFLTYGLIVEALENPSRIFTYFYIGLLLLAGCKLLLQGNTWREWILVLLLLTVGLCSYLGCTDKVSLFFMVAVCCARNAKVEKVIRLDLIMKIVKIVSYLTLPFLGVFPNHIAVEIGGRPRTYFAWAHPNGMGMTFLAFCVDWIYLKHGKMKWYDYTGILILAGFLYATSDARTGTLIILVLLLVEALSQLFGERVKAMYKAYLAGAVGLYAVNFLQMAIGIWGLPLAQKIIPAEYGTATARFVLTNRFLELHGWTLFGSPFIDSDNLDYLDMLFPSVLLHRGIAFGVLFLLICGWAIIYGWKKKDERYLFIIIAILGYGLMENAHISLVYTVFSVLLGISVWRSDDFLLDKKSEITYSIEEYGKCKERIE